MGSAQGWRAAFTGAYDDAELALLDQWIFDGALVLDIGASLGLYTVPLALTARRRSGHVVAVEPVRGNRDVLARNLEMNGVDHVTSVMGVALGRDPGEVVMHVEPSGAGNATVVTGLHATDVRDHDRAGGTSFEERVTVVPLDSLPLPTPAAGRRCSLIKMDVEGFEGEVLAGASGFVLAHRPVIYAEFNPAWLTTRGASPSAAQEWAETNGYRCEELEYRRSSRLSEKMRVSLRSITAADERTGANLLLIPRELRNARTL